MGQAMRQRWICLAISSAVLVFAGCANRPKPLYMWEAFGKQQYKVLLREGDSPDEQIRTLEAHAEKARANNAELPPGFRAHLGMLYLENGNIQRAKELWSSEKAVFPEATSYMDRLLKQLDNPASNPTRSEKPA